MAAARPCTAMFIIFAVCVNEITATPTKPGLAFLSGHKKQLSKNQAKSLGLAENKESSVATKELLDEIKKLMPAKCKEGACDSTEVKSMPLAESTQAFGPDPASLYTIENVHASGKYLSVEYASTDVGANIVLWDDPWNENTQWRLVQRSAGVYNIENVHASGKYLTFRPGWFSNKGANIVLSNDPAYEHAQWFKRQRPEGVYAIENVGVSGLYLNVMNAQTDLGARIILWDDPWAENTQWRIVTTQSTATTTTTTTTAAATTATTTCGVTTLCPDGYKCHEGSCQAFQWIMSKSSQDCTNACAYEDKACHPVSVPNSEEEMTEVAKSANLPCAGFESCQDDCGEIPLINGGLCWWGITANNISCDGAGDAVERFCPCIEATQSETASPTHTTIQSTTHSLLPDLMPDQVLEV